MTETQVNGAETVTRDADEYKARLALVKARYDAYHREVTSRRSVSDLYHDTARGLRAVTSWLSGEYDRTYAGAHPSFGVTLQDFREHYAADSLRGVLHHLLWCEAYAGIRSEDSARELDPWRKR